MNLTKSLLLTMVVTVYLLCCGCSGVESLDELGANIFRALRDGDVGILKNLQATEKEVNKVFGDKQLIRLATVTYSRSYALTFSKDPFDENFRSRFNYLQQQRAEYLQTGVLHEDGDIAEIAIWCKRHDGTRFMILAFAYKSNRGWVLINYA